MADRDDIFLFAGFRLDRRVGSLFRCSEDGALTPVPIGPRALDVLGVLVARAGDLVSRDEIIAAAWPEAVVNDNNLNMQIAAIRRVLDDGEAMPSCIQTIPRRGYRFVSPVTRAGPPAQLIPVQPLHPGDQDYAARAGPKSRSRFRGRRAIMAGVVGALVLAIIASAAWNLPSRWFAGARSVPRLSIVVLPFANLGGDPGRQYFADGLTEDLTTDLSRLADMLVISRDTAFTYKEKPVNAKRIGHELGVRYVLEGSVQRSANQVRINAQLIDAESDRGVFGLCCLDGPPHPGAFIREKILDELGLFGSRSCTGAGRGRITMTDLVNGNPAFGGKGLRIEKPFGLAR